MFVCIPAEPWEASPKLYVAILERTNAKVFVVPLTVNHDSKPLP